MHGLILAGGEGSRLSADGITIPKALVPLAGQPLIGRLVDTFKTIGCETVTCAVRRPVANAVNQMVLAGALPGATILSCETSSSLHTLAAGLEVMPPGPAFCSMVDTIMPLEDWHRVFQSATRALAEGADAVVAVTPFVDDEKPLYVARRPDGWIGAFSGQETTPPLVTGGVYLLSSRTRDLVPRVVGLGLGRMRGFLAWLVEHGYRVGSAEVERIVDVDRRWDLELATAWLGGVE